MNMKLLILALLALAFLSGITSLSEAMSVDGYFSSKNITFTIPAGAHQTSIEYPYNYENSTIVGINLTGIALARADKNASLEILCKDSANNTVEKQILQNSTGSNADGWVIIGMNANATTSGSNVTCFYNNANANNPEGTLVRLSENYEGYTKGIATPNWVQDNVRGVVWTHTNYANMSVAGNGENASSCSWCGNGINLLNTTALGDLALAYWNGQLFTVPTYPYSIRFSYNIIRSQGQLIAFDTSPSSSALVNRVYTLPAPMKQYTGAGYVDYSPELTTANNQWYNMTFVLNAAANYSVYLNNTASMETTTWPAGGTIVNITFGGASDASIAAVGIDNLIIVKGKLQNATAKSSITIGAQETINKIRVDYPDGVPPSEGFVATFSNGTYSKAYVSTTRLALVYLSDLPTGLTNLSVTKSGYRTNNTISFNINSTTTFDTTAYLSEATFFISTFDEKSPSTALTFNVTFANSTLSKTWTGQTSFSQKGSNLTLGDTTITISSTGYNTRKYIMTITASTYENLSAYLLQTSQGQVVRFHTVTVGNQPIPNVLATAQLSIGEVLTTVEQEVSDGSGTATVFLDPTSTYTMTFTHPSYTTVTSSIHPSQQDYTITMAGLASFVNNTFTWGDVTMTLLPTNTNLLRHSPGNETFNFSVNAPSSDLTDWGWLMYSNGSTLYSNTLYTANGGTDSFILNTTNLSGFLYVDTFFTKGGQTTTITSIFTMNNITLGNNTLENIFSGIKSNSYGFQRTTLFLIGLIIEMLVMGFVARYTLSGAGIVGVFVGLFLAYAGIFPFALVEISAIVVFAILIIKGVF